MANAELEKRVRELEEMMESVGFVVGGLVKQTRDFESSFSKGENPVEDGAAEHFERGFNKGNKK